MTRTDSGVAGTADPDGPPGDDAADERHEPAEGRPAPVRLTDISGLGGDEYKPL